MTQIFEINDLKDCLRELEDTVADLKQNPLNPRIARYGAIVAWSMCDWIYDEYGSQLQFKNLKHLQDTVKGQCVELSYLQDLGNLRKHREITRYTPVLRKAIEHKGEFSSAFSRDFDISRLQLVLQNGEIVDYEDVLEATLSFWECYFANNGL